MGPALPQTMPAAHAVDQAVAFLQKTSTVSGGSVYQDLARVIGHILLEKPENAVDLLETTFLAKKAAYTPSDPTALPEPKVTEKVSAIRGLYVTPEPEVDPDTGVPEPAQPPNDYTGEDLLEADDLFAAVGVGLGRIHTYQVAMATQRLGENPDLQLASVRFFGKIFGLKADYYIYEATLKEPSGPPEVDTVPPMEVATGANAFTYFVQPYPGGPTTRLPDVTPAQMAGSKLQKRLFTGDLTAEVSTYPLFPGKEAEYLRAQIGHLAAETYLVPSGMFTVGDGNVLEQTEDFTAPSAEDAATPEGWARKFPQINEQGRCETWVEDPEEQGEPDPPALLTALDPPQWATITNTTVSGAKHQVSGVASVMWPGAFVVSCNGRFGNIYIGDGVRNQPYKPPPPPPLQAEYNTEELQESAELPPKPEDPEPEEQPEGEEGAEEGAEEE